MIPTAQLDPASLTLWYNPEIISQSPDGELLGDTVWHAMAGDIDGVVGTVDRGLEAGCGVRCAHLASVVWHEQRHYIDLILSNHGAFRVRQFLSLYANLSQLLGEVRQDGCTLIVPVTVYADDVRAAVHGVSAEPSSALRRVAEDVKNRARMVADDRATISLPMGAIEFGGEAQLEALAFFSQFVALDLYLGRELNLPVQRDLPGGMPGLRYRWASILAAQLGLSPVAEREDGVAELDVTYLSAILYGALASRRWGQEQTHHPGGSSSGFPGARLYGLIAALRSRGQRDAPADELWAEVNDATERLWGRSAIDEMLIDYRFEGEWVDSIAGNPDTPDRVREVVVDFHTVRGVLLAILQTNPIPILDPYGYAGVMLPSVRPIPIIANPSGMTGPLEPGLERVLGFDGGSGDANDSWLWAWTPGDWDAIARDRIGPQARTAWLQMVSYFAPMAKLLMNGCRHRTMLGPELEMAMAQLTNLEIDFRIDPLFEPSSEVAGAALFFHLSGKSHAACDYCHADIDAPDGHLLSPWVFRRNAAIADHIKDMLGGGTAGDRRFRRDWSPWLLCDTCFARFAHSGAFG